MSTLPHNSNDATEEDGVGTFWQREGQQHQEQNAEKREGLRGKGRDSAIAALSRIVHAEAELFLNQDSVAFATVRVGDHNETMAVDSSKFRQWLTMKYFAAKGAAASAEKLKEAMTLATAKANFFERRETTWLRVGWGENGKHYLDLGDDSWRAVETDAEGWRIVAVPPIKFRRSGREQTLPEPVKYWAGNQGGSTNPRYDHLPFLLALVRLRSGDREQTRAAYRLLLGFMFDCLRPGRDHAILNLVGRPAPARPAPPKSS